VSKKRDIQALKVHRLYRQYQSALEELEHQKRLFKEAKIRVEQAMSKELFARDAYNEALAEYRTTKDET
jgi:hypothetical protein